MRTVSLCILLDQAFIFTLKHKYAGYCRMWLTYHEPCKHDKTKPSHCIRSHLKEDCRKRKNLTINKPCRIRIQVIDTPTFNFILDL